MNLCITEYTNIFSKSYQIAYNNSLLCLLNNKSEFMLYATHNSKKETELNFQTFIFFTTVLSFLNNVIHTWNAKNKLFYWNKFFEMNDGKIWNIMTKTKLRIPENLLSAAITKKIYIHFMWFFFYSTKEIWKWYIYFVLRECRLLFLFLQSTFFLLKTVLCFYRRLFFYSCYLYKRLNF